VGDAKVRQDRVARFQHDVRRLHIPVDHAPLMRVGKRIGDLSGNSDGVIDGKLFLSR
jgi:hypothetical protein